MTIISDASIEVKGKKFFSFTLRDPLTVCYDQCMTKNDDTATAELARLAAQTAAMTAATERRLAELREPLIMPERPARRNIFRSRRNSVPHRSIR